MQAAIFYSVPSVAYEWEDVLKKNGFEVDMRNTIPITEEDSLDKQMDLIILQTTAGARTDSATLLKSMGYNPEEIPVWHSFYFVNKLRQPDNPNKKTPVIYTTLANGERLSEIKKTFDSLPNTYFFDERSTDGIGPLIKKILESQTADE